MQPAGPAPSEPFPWVYVVGGVIAVLSVLFFFQTRDPMILIFGLMAGAMLVGVLFLIKTTASVGFGRVMVRCASCRGLNPEDAPFCKQCGKGT